jgi:gentisate 1,2-dioxygenase
MSKDRIIKVECQCGQLLFRYLKAGPGRLIKCYLVQILDGEAEITISGKSFPVKQGEIMIMPAHEPHALKAVGRFKMLLTMIRS